MNSVLKTEIWKHLPFETILNLSKSDRQLSQLINNNNFWSYILQRDFDRTSENPKNRYLKLYRILRFFSPIIPIITQTTLNLIDEFVPDERWNEIKSELLEYMYPRKIFDAYLLIEVLDTMISKLEAESDQEDEYWEEREAEGIDVEQTKLIELLENVENGLKGKYPNVVMRIIPRRFTRNQVTIDENYYRHPAVIYVNGLKKYVNIDLDLLTTIIKYGALYGKSVNIGEIEEKLLTEIEHTD